MRGWIAVVAVVAASCQGHPSSRAFISVVDPESYPLSPHAWPAGTPIIVECWGSRSDRDRAMELVQAVHAAEEVRLDGPPMLEWTDEQWNQYHSVSRVLDRWSAEGARHPLSTITLRTEAGTRFGWLEENPTIAPVRNAGDVHSIFPRYDALPSFAGVEAAREDFDEADGLLATALAQAQLDAAAESMLNEWAGKREVNALANAVTDDALVACAHEWLD